MTMQIPDTVIYNDTAYKTAASCADLFKPYLEKHQIELFANCTAIWRGYIAKWKIENNMLFLTDIRANVQQFRKKENNNPTAGKTIHLLEGYVGLDYFFPSNDKMIFADWFSGYLLILYEHETPEVELHLFTIDKGHVISHEERYNSHPHVEEDYDDIPF